MQFCVKRNVLQRKKFQVYSICDVADFLLNIAEEGVREDRALQGIRGSTMGSMTWTELAGCATPRLVTLT